MTLSKLEKLTRENERLIAEQAKLLRLLESVWENLGVARSWLDHVTTENGIALELHKDDLNLQMANIKDILFDHDIKLDGVWYPGSDS